MPTGERPRYYDAMLRHQLMLERLKGYFYRDFNKYLNRMSRELRPIVEGGGNLGNLTRRQLSQMTREVNTAQAAIWDEWRADMLARARQLMDTDRRLAAAILQATQSPAGKPLTAKAFLERAADPDTLWASIQNEPIGANGQTLDEMLRHFTNSATVKINNAVSHGYANNLEGKEVVRNIVGEPATNSGIFRLLRNQSRAVIATGFQHVSTETHANMQGASYNTYRWVSVLDDRTTEICRHRNGKIYEYGKGPKPPAHFHCRSTIVPAITGSTPREDQNNADEWLAQQLALAVTGKVGTRLQNTVDFVNLGTSSPLSMRDFGNSADFMTGK